jgi:hypothetical protein
VNESYYHATTFKDKTMKKLVAVSSKEENIREEGEPVLDLDELAKKSRAAPTLMDFMS